MCVLIRGAISNRNRNFISACNGEMRRSIVTWRVTDAGLTRHIGACI